MVVPVRNDLFGMPMAAKTFSAVITPQGLLHFLRFEVDILHLAYLNILLVEPLKLRIAETDVFLGVVILEWGDDPSNGNRCGSIGYKQVIPGPDILPFSHPARVVRTPEKGTVIVQEHIQNPYTGITPPRPYFPDSVITICHVPILAPVDC